MVLGRCSCAASGASGSGGLGPSQYASGDLCLGTIPDVIRGNTTPDSPSFDYRWNIGRWGIKPTGPRMIYNSH